MNHETTDTPETNALADEIYARGIRVSEIAMMQHARKLERERDAAKFDADDESRWAMSYKTHRDEALARLREERQLHVQTLNERDEARAELKRVDEYATDLCCTLRCELDEERALADRLAESLDKLERACPTVGCAEMHHPSKDRHRDDEPCPVVERYGAAIRYAFENIMAWKEARK